tara:strand:+ start:4210 stop:7137 length:2928 start_codon:yes stop_codon:yes gene_type:complete
MGGSVGFQYDLKQHGINKILNIKVRDIVNGFTPEEKFPRDDLEQAEITRIIAAELKINKSGLIEDAVALGNQRRDMINDPMGTLIKNQAQKAYDGPAGPGINIGTTLSEVGQLWPGGNKFEAGKAMEGIVNTGAAIIAGGGTDMFGREKSQGDPKQLITDIGVIGTDLALAANLLDTPNNKFTTKNAIFNQLKRNPALGFASIVGTNVMAKEAGNKFYNLLNNITRTIMHLPDPSAAYAKDEKIRDLIDARDEMVWSGGALGLQHLFPVVKRLLGKTLKVNQNMPIKVGEYADAEGVMQPINENMLELAKKYNIPMNVFSTSDAALVKGAGSVISIFPFVATKSRAAQNAQQIALAENINSILNDLSPIGLFSDSAVVANKSFKTMIQKFTSTKTALYKRALKIGDEINDDFIPTYRIKEMAENLEILEYGGKRPKGKEGSLRLDQPDYDRPMNVDELLQGFIGKQTDFVDALIDMQYINKEFISGREFKKLQSQFNALKRKASADPDLGTELGGVDDFTKAMIQTLNDFGNFKKFEDPAKQALVNQFGGAMGIANEFFFNNVNYTKGRAAQILGLADKNVAKATDDIDPTMLTGEQVLKILFNDETMYSPAAIREMKAAMPSVKLSDGRIVDPVKSIARTYIDDSLRQTTRYVSGDVSMLGDASLAERGRAFLTGKVPERSKKMGTFNIPIVDIKALKNAFGLDNPNKTEAMIEIFGKEQHDRIRNVLALGEQIQQTSFGDVSAFVKRRGFLGGINAITNLAFAGFVANNPFGNVGVVLAARYGMSKMSDPKFMEGLTKIMNPELSDLARRTALINTIALAPEIAGGMREGKEDVPAELQNLDIGNPFDVMKYMIFMAENNVSYPGSENMNILINSEGYAEDVEISKVESQNEFTMDAQGVVQDMQTVAAETETESAPQGKDPFLDVDFNQVVQDTNVGMGMENAGKQLTEEQRVALAGGNIDAAIAMGSRGPV